MLLFFFTVQVWGCGGGGAKVQQMEQKKREKRDTEKNAKVSPNKLSEPVPEPRVAEIALRFLDEARTNLCDGDDVCVCLNVSVCTMLRLANNTTRS